MNIASGIFVICAILVCGITWIAISRVRTIRIRTFAVIMLGALLPVSFSAVSELMSRPKPVSMEWIKRHTEEVTVISSLMREDEAIYLWLHLPDESEPRSYTLPWSEATARELAKAEVEGEESEQSVTMRNPFKPQNMDETEPQFYVSPPQPSPPKTRVSDSPKNFDDINKKPDKFLGSSE